MQARADARGDAFVGGVIGGAETLNLDKGHGQTLQGGAGLAVQALAGQGQEALGVGQGERAGLFEHEGLALPGQGAGHSRSQIRQDEGAKQGAPHAPVAAVGKNFQRQAARAAAQTAKRRLDRRAAGVGQKIGEGAADPGRCRLVRCRSRAQGEGDLSLVVHLDQGVGGGEGQTKETGFQAHATTMRVRPLRKGFGRIREGGGV
ncbi:hypothetical protein D3C72_1029200 [compost metagenome]